jgi:hypothetical protein
LRRYIQHVTRGLEADLSLSLATKAGQEEEHQRISDAVKGTASHLARAQITELIPVLPPWKHMKGVLN